jgi:hypothetical protein
MSIYHQVFVNTSYDAPEKIDLLKKYMYAIKLEEPIPVPVPVPVPVPIPVPVLKPTIVYPDKKDTLFWCLYIANNGIADYEAIRQGYSNIEIAEKQKIMTSIKSQPTKLKSTNVKLTNIAIQEIMSDIVTNATLTVSTMVAMSVFYNKRIILIKGKDFYINVCPLDEYKETIILIKKDKNDYGIDMDVTDEKIKQIETERICLSKHDRPLEAITNYTVEQLKNLAVRLGVDSTVRLTKTGLYQQLTIRSLW